MSGPRIAYVSAEYPQISHTFIMREVEALRRRGLDVDTFTIRRTSDAAILSEADRRAREETFAVLPAAPADLALAHLSAFARGPSRYLRALRAVLGMGAAGARNRLWQLFYFAEAGLVARELRRRRLTHVHAHFVNVAASVGMCAARLAGRGTTWSFTMHGPLEFDEVTQHAIPEKVASADFVACISEFCRAQLMRLVDERHWPKLQIVHCGVRPAEYLRDARDGAPTPLRVVSVGRLAAMKGFPVLLDAMATLRRDGVAIHLTLVGAGDGEPALRARAAAAGIADDVAFAGALAPAGVVGALAAADAFCLPSFAEGVPVVLMEAMASGLPVVATRVMGIPELVEDGRSGLLVRPGRVDDLAGALRRVAELGPDGRAAMGAAGRATVAASFDVDRESEALERLFRSVA